MSLFIVLNLFISILIIIILIFFVKFLKNYYNSNPETKSARYARKLRTSYIILIVSLFIIIALYILILILVSHGL